MDGECQLHGRDFSHSSILGIVQYLYLSLLCYDIDDTLHQVSLTPRLLLTPAYSRLFPPLEPDLVTAAALWRTLHPGQPALPVLENV